MCSGLVTSILTMNAILDWPLTCHPNLNSSHPYFKIKGDQMIILACGPSIGGCMEAVVGTEVNSG